MPLKANPLKMLALSAVTAFTLSACHSSDRHLKDEPIPTPEPEPATLAIKVADGYLVGAFVFMDINGNYTFDEGEPSGTTGTGGILVLDTSDVDDPSQYTLIAEVTTALTVDEDTGTNVTNDFAMTSPAGTIIVNPITTLVQAKIANAEANGETLSLEDALADVAATLGLDPSDSNALLKDYLKPENKDLKISRAIHAIARSVVKHLPAHAAALDHSKNASLFTTLEKVAGSVAAAVHEAITAGKDPDTILVIVNPDGSVVTTTPDVNDAKDFVADIRTWGTEIALEIETPADGFTGKIDAAKLLVEADVDALMLELDNILLMIDEASVAGTLADLDATALGDANGTFEVIDKSTDTVIDFNASADLIINGQSIKFSVIAEGGPTTGAETSSGTMTFSATLANDKVSLVASNGTFSAAGYVQSTDTAEEDLSDTAVSLSVDVVATTLTDSTSVAPASFTGSLSFNAASITNQAETENYVIPTMLSLDGLWATGEESFTASLTMASTGVFTSDNSEDLSFTESMENWLDATVTLDISTDLDTIAGASIMLTIVRNGLDDGLFTVVLTYGEREITLEFNTANEKGMIVATNSDGVMLTLETLDVVDGDEVGQLLLGINKVAAITLIDGIHMIRYDDGTFETLF